MTLAGPRAWTVDEVIALCEKYADARADVSHLYLCPMLSDSPLLGVFLTEHLLTRDDINVLLRITCSAAHHAAVSDLH